MAAFCDSEGTINEEFSSSAWNVDFYEKNDSTLVEITIKHDHLSDLEKIVELGFREGFLKAMEGLDEVLLLLKR